MNSNNSFTIYPSSYNTVSAFPGFIMAEMKNLGRPRGNKRKSIERRKRWDEEFMKSISETKLDPPSGNLWYMDFRA